MVGHRTLNPGILVRIQVPQFWKKAKLIVKLSWYNSIELSYALTAKIREKSAEVSAVFLFVV